MDVFDFDPHFGVLALVVVLLVQLCRHQCFCCRVDEKSLAFRIHLICKVLSLGNQVEEVGHENVRVDHVVSSKI